MRNLIFLIGFSFFTLACHSVKKSITNHNADILLDGSLNDHGDRNGKSGNDSGKVKLFITPIKAFKSDSIIISIEFKNLTNTPLKLLDLKEDDELMINFYGIISYENGTGNIQSLLGPSFADFPSNYPFNYIEIAPKGSYYKIINVSQVLKISGKTLPSGQYKIKMGYVNIYGTGCIKGSFETDEIVFEIED